MHVIHTDRFLYKEFPFIRLSSFCAAAVRHIACNGHYNTDIPADNECDSTTTVYAERFTVRLCAVGVCRVAHQLWDRFISRFAATAT